MRRLPFILVLLAAIALVGCGWLTVISRWRGDTVTLYDSTTKVELQSSRGYAGMMLIHRTPGLFDQDSGWHANHEIDDYGPRPHLCGMEFLPMNGYHWSYQAAGMAGEGGGGMPSTTWRAVVPVHALNYPPLAVIAMVGLVLAGKSFKSRSRKKMGLCRRCGCDLRATPGRCPECGAISFSDAACGGLEPAASGVAKPGIRAT